MTDVPYLGRTLGDALARADYDKETLPHVVQVEPSDYDRIILAEYIRILEAIVQPKFNDTRLVYLNSVADEQWQRDHDRSKY